MPHKRKKISVAKKTVTKIPKTQPDSRRDATNSRPNNGMLLRRPSLPSIPWPSSSSCSNSNSHTRTHPVHQRNETPTFDELAKHVQFQMTRKARHLTDYGALVRDLKHDLSELDHAREDLQYQIKTQLRHHTTLVDSNINLKKHKDVLQDTIGKLEAEKRISQRVIDNFKCCVDQDAPQIDGGVGETGLDDSSQGRVQVTKLHARVNVLVNEKDSLEQEIKVWKDTLSSGKERLVHHKSLWEQERNLLMREKRLLSDEVAKVKRDRLENEQKLRGEIAKLEEGNNAMKHEHDKKVKEICDLKSRLSKASLGDEPKLSPLDNLKKIKLTEEYKALEKLVLKLEQRNKTLMNENMKYEIDWENKCAQLKEVEIKHKKLLGDHHKLRLGRDRSRDRGRGHMEHDRWRPGEVDRDRDRKSRSTSSSRNDNRSSRGDSRKSKDDITKLKSEVKKLGTQLKIYNGKMNETDLELLEWKQRVAELENALQRSNEQNITNTKEFKLLKGLKPKYDSMRIKYQQLSAEQQQWNDERKLKNETVQQLEVQLETHLKNQRSIISHHVQERSVLQSKLAQCEADLRKAKAERISQIVGALTPIFAKKTQTHNSSISTSSKRPHTLQAAYLQGTSLDRNPRRAYYQQASSPAKNELQARNTQNMTPPRGVSQNQTESSLPQTRNTEGTDQRKENETNSQSQPRQLFEMTASQQLEVMEPGSGQTGTQFGATSTIGDPAQGRQTISSLVALKRLNCPSTPIPMPVLSPAQPMESLESTEIGDLGPRASGWLAPPNSSSSAHAEQYQSRRQILDHVRMGPDIMLPLDTDSSGNSEITDVGTSSSATNVTPVVNDNDVYSNASIFTGARSSLSSQLSQRQFCSDSHPPISPHQ